MSDGRGKSSVTVFTITAGSNSGFPSAHGYDDNTLSQGCGSTTLTAYNGYVIESLMVDAGSGNDVTFVVHGSVPDTDAFFTSITLNGQTYLRSARSMYYHPTGMTMWYWSPVVGGPLTVGSNYTVSIH